jgi:hypothetical protein
VPVATFAGAAGALGIVYAMSIARRRGTSSTVLLLAGVALSAFLGALNRFIQVIGDYTDTFRSIRWMMGSMDVGSYTDIVVALVPIAAACIAIGTLPRELDLVSIGAEAAESRGVDVRRAERVALVSASLLTDPRSRSGTDSVRRHHRAAHRAADRRRQSPAGSARRRRSSAARFSSSATSSRARRSARRECRSAPSRHFWEVRFFYGCCFDACASR